MIRITKTESPNAITLQIEGNLTASDIDTVQQECDRVADKRLLQLDLEKVPFADRQVIKFLCKLRVQGIPLISCQPFLSESLLRSR